MPAEQEGRQVSLRAIRIDLEERSVTFEAADAAAAKLTLSPEGVLFEYLPASVDSVQPEAAGGIGGPAAPPENGERAKTVTLSGRLKSQAKEGKKDRSGNPTAWARFAAHEEDNPEARMLLLSFHRATARIALSLAQGDPITVQGYLHPSNGPEGKRLDTFSAFSLLHYPGKPVKH